jgi:death-on-curing protein
VSGRFLTLEIVLEVVARQGWQVKDAGLLDSALMRPRATAFGQDAYPSLALKAAALLHSVAQNQALVDGNKRLALLCAHAFLAINGAEITADDDDVFQLLDVDVVTGLSDVAEIARRLQVTPV